MLYIQFNNNNNFKNCINNKITAYFVKLNLSLCKLKKNSKMYTNF